MANMMKIYYALDMPFPFGPIFPNLTRDNLKQTHVELIELSERTLEDVFNTMQADRWAQQYETTNELLRSKGLSHTSMSIGDVVVDWAGNGFICMPHGWMDFTPRMLFYLDKKVEVTTEQVYKACTWFAESCKDTICKMYAEEVVKHNLKGDALDCQIDYILTNAGSWRGEEARNAKALLRLWQAQYRKALKKSKKEK